MLKFVQFDTATSKQEMKAIQPVSEVFQIIMLICFHNLEEITTEKSRKNNQIYQLMYNLPPFPDLHDAIGARCIAGAA